MSLTPAIDLAPPLDRFVVERSDDAKLLLNSLTPFKLPHHLRRRARSWRPFRHASKVKVKKREALSRHHRRRPGVLLNSRTSGTGGLRWLATHLWHAKRTRMETLWTYRLAMTNCSMGRRALYRASTRYCCIHDRSYLGLLQLLGSESDIAETLVKCGLDRRLVLAASMRQGAHRGRGLLYDAELRNRNVQKLIAPIMFLWCPEPEAWDREENTEEVFFVDAGHGVEENPDAPMCPTRCLWIWVHPSAESDTHASLSHAADMVVREDAFARNVSASCQVKRIELTWLSGAGLFELTGPRSIEVLGRTLPLADSNNSSAHIWREITTSSRAKVPPAGAVLALDLNAELLNSCVTRGAGGAVKSSSHPWVGKWPEHASAGSSLWEALRGLTTSGATVSGRLSVLVIFRDSDSLGGVDVVLPIGAAKKIWLRCVFASARILGVSDRHALHTEAGLHDFPFDFPETLAGDAVASSEASLSIEKYAKRPPAKRVNHGALAVPCPYAADWSLVRPGPPTRPDVLRLPRTRSIPFCEKDLVAVILVCSLRRRPKVRCHLYALAPADFPVHRSRGTRRAAVEPPDLGAQRSMQIDEPLHRRMKRRELRRVRERDSQTTSVTRRRPDEPIRQLIGFVTSGDFSYRRGRGAGVGAVAAVPFAVAFREQHSAGWSEGDWVCLWARNTTSLSYFPVWAKAACRDEGPG